MIDEKYIRKHVWEASRHNKLFFAKIEKQMAHLLHPQSLKAVKLIIDEIMKLGVPTKHSKQSFVENVILGYAQNKVQVFSMNSSSLTANPEILRDKPQYKKITYLNDMVKKIEEQTGVSFTYTSILPDYDIRFPFENFESAWEKNRIQLENISGIEAKRLSQIAPKRFEDIQAHLEDYMDTSLLNEKIKEHAQSYTDIDNFNAPKDFSKQQIMSYSITGIVLEEILPTGILLDVQKRYYPFEQPFYNFARENKLPIILCGQQIPDGRPKQTFKFLQTMRDL